nr:chemotaxis response regulator protein-glutamate methylesterase [Ktedonobacterales bacterium]
GMGHDGTAGAGAILDAGGWALAQDEASCVIYGMPRSVAEAGFASSVVPLDSIAREIVAGLANSTPRRRN